MPFWGVFRRISDNLTFRNVVLVLYTTSTRRETRGGRRVWGPWRPHNRSRSRTVEAARGDIGQIASDPPLGGLPGAIWRFEVFFKGFLPI